MKTLPAHLQRYVVEQNYARYTSEDQAVWRYILRQLKKFLGKHAHECYLKGLEQTGITTEEIPRIENIDEKLSRFGWSAVPVSGFIPPAAFMEFQSLGILPIASDMRSLDHLLYTPAPDIVHEAAGHAPILIDPDFASYLKKYANVARNAILSAEDLAQYEAIRILSDLKEMPNAPKHTIQNAEANLTNINSSMRYTSEGSLISRMNWWTAEYGLIGDIKNPKIFGAGLLSSVGESRWCLSDKVKKIPLTIDCINYGYDITEPQPQLFVVKDFIKLHDVLDELEKRMAFRKGGAYALSQLKMSESVNTLQLNNGLQISGKLVDYKPSENPYFIRFGGPCQLAYKGEELKDQGTARHAHGFSTPLGTTDKSERLEDLAKNWNNGAKIHLRYKSGIELKGTLVRKGLHEGHLLYLTLNDCSITLGSEQLYKPEWGEMDLALGESVACVLSGPADRKKFEIDDFVNQRVPERQFTEDQQFTFDIFKNLRKARETKNQTLWIQSIDVFLSKQELPWLVGLEIIELAHMNQWKSDKLLAVEAQSKKTSKQDHDQSCFEDGLQLLQ